MIFVIDFETLVDKDAKTKGKEYRRTYDTFI